MKHGFLLNVRSGCPQISIYDCSRVRLNLQFECICKLFAFSSYLLIIHTASDLSTPILLSSSPALRYYNHAYICFTAFGPRYHDIIVWQQLLRLRPTSILNAPLLVPKL